MAYRKTRNFEASTYDKIESALTDGSWTNVSVQLGFSKVYEITVGGSSKKAIVTIRVEDTRHEHAEIGSSSTLRYPLVFIDLFCANDGQRLDLKDFLISELKSGWNFYEYTITDGSVDTKVPSGRIEILSIEDTPVNFDLEKDNLPIHDRFRHLITLEVALNELEG